ncbi:MAG: NIPSNAP family protein [Bacteroidota bacterium]
MKVFRLSLVSICISFLLSCVPPANTDPGTPTPKYDREFYQIITYLFESEEQVLATDTYLREALMPGLKRQGIGQIGVFKQYLQEEDSLKRTFILIPLTSPSQFYELEKGLTSDSAYQSAGADYISAVYNQPPFIRKEYTLLEAFRDMPFMNEPNLEGPRNERIYELRSYESATEAIFQNKVDMFNQGGEITLFDDLGFNAVFYAEVIAGAKMPNLMYMTTFENQESRDAHWKSFVDSPVWKNLKEDPQYQDNVSHIDIYFLYPTQYSDY